MDEQPDAVHEPAGAMDRRAELSEFLRTRRARLKPEDVGLPDFGRHRRVPGLRREELAQLAGMSVAYYTRLAKPKQHKKKPAARTQQVRASLRQLLDSIDGFPAYISGRRSDILAWN